MSQAVRSKRLNSYWDLIRVSAHLGARYGDGGQNPSNHFLWQGKLYSRTGKTEEYPLFEESTGYGTGEGLCGYNCRHSFGPGDPEHNPYQDFDAEENKKVYDLSQKQRRAESRIRKTKSKLIALREAMDCSENEEVKAAIQEEYNKEAAKLTKYNAQYDKFCKDNNLKKLNDRISVAKWNRSEAAKARSTANKLQKPILKNAAGRAIIEVKSTSLKGPQNGITQRINKKGGIDRNYYDQNGDQVKQISNNDHGHRKESSFGNHGEHAHDYFKDENGALRHGEPRELSEYERKENADIL